jgi:hypothetical protein
VSKALCSGFDAFAIAIGILLDAGEDVLVIGKVHFDFFTGRDEMNDVGRGELISNHDHELVLRKDLNERRDGGLRLLEALEVESALVFGDCRSLFGTFWRHRDEPRGEVYQSSTQSKRKVADDITEEVFCCRRCVSGTKAIECSEA